MDEGPDIQFAFHAAVLHAALDTRPVALADALAALHAGLSGKDRTATASRLVRRLLAACGSAPDWAVGEQVAAWLQAPGRRLITLHDRTYPPLLAAIPSPPPVLFVDGHLHALDVPQLAIVGSRRATLFGREFARELAEGVVAAGLTVTSGLAAGVDGAAHEGALAAGGTTIAVFGCGIDQRYPRHHARLAEAVRANGVLLSEFPLGTGPRPYHFPRRNRIISGLSLGTLVVEAAVTSGSLVTARHALDQGREVFAVPGAVRNPLSRGCHALLRDGATLVESVQDVLHALPGTFVHPCSTSCSQKETRGEPGLSRLPAPARNVMAACDFEPRGIDRIVEVCGLTAPEVSSILTALEMQGVVRAVGGGAYVLTGKIPA